MSLRIRTALLSGISLAALLAAPAQAQTAPQLSNDDLTRILITGGTSNLKRLPGSAYVVEGKTLEQLHTGDINRVLQEVPGLNVQEEDGRGLRPNIGMRGGRVDRSSDITLMEDGVLIAPAPYAAPEAYYFPRIDRMEAVEVRKGSSSIQYGPRTTSGALNLVSRSIPSGFGGGVDFAIGSHGDRQAGTHVGGSSEHFGALIDATHSESDGFKDIDRVGGGTGYTVRDGMAKFRINSRRDGEVYNALEFKVGATDEDSDETYLGLTDADFRADPYRRYAASQLDNLQADHRQYQVRHVVKHRGLGLSLDTTAYRNEFERSWYKLQSVRANGEKEGLADVLNDPAAFADHLAILRGDTDGGANSLQVRANNRQYQAQGVQTAGTYRFNLGGIANKLEVGVRYHEDEQDRLQHEDGYAILGGRMALTTPGAAGSESNRIGSAEAWALHVLHEFDFGRLRVMPGVRYESIDLKTRDFGKTDPARSGTGLNTYEQNISAVIPGVGAQFDITPAWAVFGGVHKGFAPPEPPTSTAAANNLQEERSVNYEAGLRYDARGLKGELTGFFNDYDNLLGRDTFSSGGTGASEEFNGGEVHAYGVEASAGYDLAGFAGLRDYRLPLKVAYTYTRAEFQNTFDSGFDEWGDVTSGDALPYIPEHQFFAQLGLETDRWGVFARGKYVGEMRTVAGQGALDPLYSTDANFIVDLGGDYEIVKGTRAFMNVYNVFDEEYVAARRPAGARPGLPRAVLAGLKMKF